MHLFAPLQLRSVTLPNRIAVSPMCQYSSDDGFANDWHLVHLGSRAVGGAGMVIAEATSVSPEGRISPEDLGIWKDEHVPFLSRIAAFIRQQGSVAAIQLAHAGRKASMARPWDEPGIVPVERGGWTDVVGPSDSPFSDRYAQPHALDAAGIRRIVDDFRQATRRSLEAGFQVVEIHAAHGYLLHSFISPTSNLRTDAYGGSFENRIRLVMEVIEAVRAEWPADLPVLMRVSATDWTEGGWDLAQTIELSKLAHANGVDLIDCSTGGNVAGATIPVGPGYQVSFAEAIRQSGVPSGAVGLITSAEQADGIISSGQADLVLLARELLRDPYWPLRAAKRLGADVPWPKQYERARD